MDTAGAVLSAAGTAAGEGRQPAVTGPRRAPNLRQRFGQRVRELRSRRGMTQRELARRAGMHPSYVGGVERGERNVTLDAVERLADALQVAAADLMLDPHPGPGPSPGPEARMASLVSRAASPADVALALDVAGYLVDRLARLRQGERAAAAEGPPPSPYG